MPNLLFLPAPCLIVIPVPAHHRAGYFWRAPGADWREISWAVWCIFRWFRIDGAYRHNGRAR